MNCPRCRASILTDDVNLPHLLAKCRQCGEIFRLSTPATEAESDSEQSYGSIERTTLPAPTPDGYEIDETNGRRRVIRQWFQPDKIIGFVIFAAICVIFDGAFAFWIFLAVIGEGACPCSLVHAAVGGFFTYMVLAGLANSTVIEIAGDELCVTHGPLPWWGNSRQPIAPIRQLYCVEPIKVLRNPDSESAVVNIELRALLKNGDQRLVISVSSKEEGLFLEQVIEEWLSIKPERVPGQVD